MTLRPTPRARPARLAALAVVLLLLAAAGLAADRLTRPAPVTELRIDLDRLAHARFGLHYPITFHLTVPVGGGELTAHYRYDAAETWSALPSGLGISAKSSGRASTLHSASRGPAGEPSL